MDLFRPEVARSKAPRLLGTVNLAQPLSWAVISVVLTTIVIVLGIFFASATYSKSEMAAGTIAPEGGMLEIVPPRAGRVDAVLVSEGETVRRGSILARVQAEEVAVSGAGAQAGVVAAIQDRDRTLLDQETSIRAASVSEQQGLIAQIEGLRSEISNLDTQILAQKKLIAMAGSELERAREVGARGYISRREIATREETLIARSQQLSSLEQSRAAKLGSLRHDERAREEAGARAAAALSAIASNRADARKEIATAHAAQGFALISPTNGIVASLSLHAGDSVTTQEPVLTIVPSGGKMLARLYVPGKAAGFVRVGQEVQLGFEAFPPERFGSVNARIVRMSSAPVSRPASGGGVMPVYVAIALLERPYIIAYGRKEPLLPGMAFSARIITERRSLLKWLFDPLYAAVGR